MKKRLLFSLTSFILAFSLQAQVTQINSNKTLQVTIPLSTTKIILVSQLDSSIWVTDATLPGTFQLSPNIKFEDEWQLIPGGKVVFRGSTAATGSEIYISDGTVAGTNLVADIVAGTTGSDPDEMTGLNNGVVYFTAATPTQGRELWKTDGTLAGTSIVKDINSGTASSNTKFNYHLTSNGTYLFFAAGDGSAGLEPWRSDGTSGGTIMLQDINPLADSSNPRQFLTAINNNIVLFVANKPGLGEELWRTDGTPGGTSLLLDINPLQDSSNPRFFYRYNNMLLFLATHKDYGEELWRTDGTTAGTFMVKDIYTGTSSSTSKLFLPGITYPIFKGFHLFNNRVYFNATNGASNGQIWSSDGTDANTVLLKDVIPSTTTFPYTLLTDAVNLPNKFIFPVTDQANRAELWECDGTTNGTKLFKAFNAPSPGDVPFILLSYSFDPVSGNITYPLFQGDKFFFVADQTATGRELWVSNGADSLVANTHIVKDINPNAANGINTEAPSYLYTKTNLFFAADNGTLGNELWKTDGTDAGTAIVKDINPNAGDADPEFPLLFNRKVIFNATDGDAGIDTTDLYVIDGNFDPLPIKLSEFTVRLKTQDAVLQWTTSNEVNTKDFTVQRSYDGQHFESIGTVPAINTSSSKHEYSFIDAGVGNSGKNIIYYRILSLDKDGKSESTNIIFIKLKGNNEWNVRLLTNPVQSDATLMLTGITGNLQLSIKDLNGKVLYNASRQNVNGQISIPVSNLAHGIYILVAELNNERKSFKFVKQ